MFARFATASRPHRFSPGLVVMLVGERYEPGSNAFIGNRSGPLNWFAAKNAA